VAPGQSQAVPGQPDNSKKTATPGQPGNAGTSSGKSIVEIEESIWKEIVAKNYRKAYDLMISYGDTGDVRPVGIALNF
jgi:hypothetical protein